MPTCEICGKKTNKLYRVKVEGVEMLVCKDCVKYGELIGEVDEGKKKKVKKKIIVPVEKEEVVIPEYASILRKKREELGLNQEEMAKKLKIKESLYQKIEDGKLEPTIDLAKRIEKELGIKLVEEILTENVKIKSTKEEATLGDIVTIRKRNK